MSKSAIPKRVRDLIVTRDGSCCRYCGIRQFGQGAVFHVNHVLPKSKGGRTTPENLVLQCPYCSLHKANKTKAADPNTGRSVAIFNPLLQDWDEHF